MPIDPRKLVVGDRVPGTKWVVCSKLGAGGMGVVFEVVIPPGIRGAMKIMLPNLAERREYVDGFLNEVRLTAAIDHRNIVRVIYFDELEDGTLYYVMEYLQGSTLRAAMSLYAEDLAQKKSPLTDGLLKPPAVYEIVSQVCSALDRAHEAGIVHRDLKPENIMLHAPDGDEPTVKVGDFGIAVLYRDKRVRGVTGTPKYMAPEQFRDERATPRTDLFALGLITYEMLTGRFPWELPSSTIAALRQAHLRAPPIPPSRFVPALSPELDELLLSAIALKPEDRPRDAVEFSNRLYDLTSERPSSADVNATDPTFGTLAGLVPRRRRDDSDAAGGSGHLRTPTFRGMTPPPLEGRSLELAPDLSGGAEPAPSSPALVPAPIKHIATPTAPVPVLVQPWPAAWDASPPAPAPAPATTTRPVTDSLVDPRSSQSDGGTSVSGRLHAEPVVTISRRTLYRTLVVAPVMAVAGSLLVFAVARAGRPGSAPTASASTSALPPTSPVSTDKPVATPAMPSIPAATAAIPAAAAPMAARAPIAAPTSVAPVVRPTAAPAIAPTKPRAPVHPPRDDGRDLLPDEP